MTAKSQRSASSILVTVSTLACSSSTMAPSPSTLDATWDGMADTTLEPTSEPPPRTEAVEHRAFRYLLGRFDSAPQALADPRYFSIRVEACRVEAPSLGARVLYLEQSRTGMAPYRQRLYVLERDGADDRAVSRVFELNIPGKYVGLCDDPSRVAFTSDDVVAREGCAVYLTARGDGFVGGTMGRSCESTLMGASYATSEVELRPDGFTSWDRGYDASDRQVWGATAGPYRFVRRTPLEPAAP